MKSKLKTFFKIFWRSLTDISYYKDIAKAKFSFSLKYLYIFLFFVALARGIVFASSLSFIIPEIPQFIENAKDAARELYPAELVLTFEDGKLSTNVEEPYYIEIPSQFRDGVDADEPVSLAVIDTSASVEDLSQYETVFLITETALVAPDDDTRGVGGYRVIPFDDFGDDSEALSGVFDRNIYIQVVDQLLPYLDNLPSIVYGLIVGALLVWPFFAGAVSLVGSMIYLLFMTVVVLIFAKIVKRDLEYGKLYQLGMHGATLPILITTVLAGFSIYVPLLYTLIFLVFMGMVVVKFSKE